MHKTLKLIITLVLLSTFSFTYAVQSTRDYAFYLAKTIDDVVNSIHATVPNSKINHADVLAIICIEQKSLKIDNSSAASRAAGARGLTQVTDKTFRNYYNKNIRGFADFARRHNCNAYNLSHDVRCSIEAGARIFNDLLIRYNGNRNMAAGAYHGGTGSVLSPTQYKGMLTTKYATQWFPKCYNNIVQGNSPVASDIWRNLVSSLSNITNGKFTLSGPAHLVAYTASNMFQPQNQQSWWGNMRAWFSGPRDFSHGSLPYRSPSYAYKSNYNGSKLNVEYENKDKAFFEWQQEREDSVQVDTYTDDSSGTATHLNENNDFSEKVNQDDSGTYWDQNDEKKAFLKCFPSVLERGEPFFVVYSCGRYGKTKLIGAKDSGKNYGLDMQRASENKKISLYCAENNEEYVATCDISVKNPKIAEFYISPTNPKNGQTASLYWATKDMRSCLVRVGSKESSGLSGVLNFKYDNSIPISIECISLNNLNFSQKI